LRELHKTGLFDCYLVKEDLIRSLNEESIKEMTDMGPTFG
jgi:hypothetical protein